MGPEAASAHNTEAPQFLTHHSLSLALWSQKIAKEHSTHKHGIHKGRVGGRNKTSQQPKIIHVNFLSRTGKASKASNGTATQQGKLVSPEKQLDDKSTVSGHGKRHQKLDLLSYFAAFLVPLLREKKSLPKQGEETLHKKPNRQEKPNGGWAFPYRNS